MAIHVKEGETLVAARQHNGCSAKGEWECIKIPDSGKGRKSLTIWTNNAPSGVKEGDTFRVVKITGVSFSARKDNKGEWKDEVSVNATVVPVTGEQTTIGGGTGGNPFVEMKDDEEGDLPF